MRKQWLKVLPGLIKLRTFRGLRELFSNQENDEFIPHSDTLGKYFINNTAYILVLNPHVIDRLNNRIGYSVSSRVEH